MEAELYQVSRHNAGRKDVLWNLSVKWQTTFGTGPRYDTILQNNSTFKRYKLSIVVKMSAESDQMHLEP